MFDFFHALKWSLTTLVVVVLSLFSSPPTFIATSTPIAGVSTSTLVAETPKTPLVQTPATSTKPEEKPKEKTPAPQKKEVLVPIEAKPAGPVETPTPLPDTPAPLSWDAINEQTRAATVNILCTSASGGLLNPVSGSGVLIDPRGVILVNAHLAQYLLVKDSPVKDFLDCVVRLGSPASPRYHAKLVYISPAWARTHYEEVLVQSPTGTGENDFGLLLVGEPTGPSIQKPEKFPYLDIGLVETSDLIGHPVIITAYPAGFLGGINIQMNLFLSSATATIQDVYTFIEDTVDLLSLGGSVVSQRGSSGGAVVNASGELIGIVVTSSEAPTTGERDLRAITISHINRVLQKETGVSLREFLAQDIQAVGEQFRNEIAPELAKPFIQKLNDATPR
ncbi:MAG TPA: trypsin-like peptidase domain-containing protein [Candidatus Paceibacterota bacterium]